MRLRLSTLFEVVGEASTGVEALEVVAAVDPDLVLLDVSMPDMDGLDALAHLRERAPRTQVVMFSGFEEQGLAERAHQLGAVDFVEKSIPIEELAGRLAAALDDIPVQGGQQAADPEPILREHLERFRAAFDQAAVGMATLTLTGRIVRANRSLESVAGAAEGRLVGTPYEALANDAAALSKVITEVASGEREVAVSEHNIGARSVVSTFALVRDSRGTPLYLSLQAQDVTERRAAEEQLLRSEERFRLLVESVADYAIFMLDPGGHIVSWNIGAERAKGYTAADVLGRHFSIFYLPDAVAAEHPQRELEIASAEGRYEEEGWRVRKDGSTFWANVIITAIRGPKGDLVGFAKVTRDVTERRQLLENLRAAAAERTQLLAVTAHELRTPVAIVNGFVKTLVQHWDELDEGERRQMVESAARGGDRLGRLVDDLLTAARLESGALEMRTRRFELATLVEETVADLATGDIEVVTEPVDVLADHDRVRQMVANYLTNALRYGTGPIKVTVSIVDGAARVVVSDVGPGIDQTLEPRLFTKFAGSGAQDSTGLGLFIVRELARAQGGDAWYEPVPGGGSAFALRLPIAS